MNIEEELKLPNWNEYKPLDEEYYLNTDKQDLLCRFKLVQVYQNFCIARANFIFSDKDTNYGELDPDGKNKYWLEKFFLQNALLYYNICIDLSWVMVYFYYIPKKEEEFNITEKEIEEIEKGVSYDNLLAFLKIQVNLADSKERIILEKIIELITEFYNNKIPEDFRKDYNYIKHRGTYDIFDTEDNVTTIQFLVNNKEPNISIPKFKTFDNEKYIDILKKFHKSFLEYINQIIDIIIKPKLSSQNFSLDDAINNAVSNQLPK